MSLGRREARHQTSAAAKVAGVEPSADWDFQPGQRVQTVDGLAGRVTAVQDGPVRGAEGYEVTLDDGMGGGLYTSSQLAPAPETTASLQETAAADYPELEDILQTRPDIAKNTVLGSLKTAADGDLSDDGDDGYGPEIYCVECGTYHGERRHKTSPAKDYDGVDTSVGGDTLANGMASGDSGGSDSGSRAASLQVEGTWSYTRHSEPIKHHYGQPAPRPLQAGDSIIAENGTEHPIDAHAEGLLMLRGRSTPIHRGPAEGDLSKVIWSSDSVDEAGQDVPKASEEQLKYLDSNTTGPTKYSSKTAADDDWEVSHGAYLDQQKAADDDDEAEYQRRVRKNQDDSTIANTGLDDQVDKAFKEVPSSDLMGKFLDSNPTGPTKYSALEIFDPFDILVTASADPDFRFEVTAAWSDVRRKAKRIRAEGGVHVTLASEGSIFAEVKGDHNVYETGLQRLPGKQSAQQWSCGCKWGAYHWGADDDFSRFAGRMCSHALALQFEAQSRGMFGRTIRPDGEKPEWAPRRVVVKYDIDADTNRMAPATMPEYGRVASTYYPTGWFPTGDHCQEDPNDDSRCTYHDEYHDQISDKHLDRITSTLVPEQSALSRLAFYAKAEGFTAEDFTVECVLAGITGSVNSPWGEPQPEVPEVTGPTRPPHATDNPASQGFASQPDPDSWGGLQTPDTLAMGASLHDEFLFEAEIEKEGYGRALMMAAPLVLDMLKGDKEEEAPAAAPAAPAPPTQDDKRREDAAAHALPTQAAGGPVPFSPPLGEESLTPDAGAESMLHEEPEAALPSTDGDLMPRQWTTDPVGSGPANGNGSPSSGAGLAPGMNFKSDPTSLEAESPSIMSTGSVEDIVASFQQKAAHLNPMSGNGDIAGMSGNGDIAAAAREFLSKEAVKDFTPGEQAQIINEGEHVTAANLDRLDIAGTHYEPLEAALAARDEEDDDEAWMA